MTGDNSYGQYGNGNNADKNTPVKIMDNVAQVSCGGYCTGILKTDGSLWMAGRNMYGQLGDDTRVDKSTPVKIMDNVAQVSCGGLCTGILKTDGSLWMTGGNEYGQLGDGTNADKKTPVKIMDNVAQVSFGTFGTGILKRDGSLWMTGGNEYGQLGDGTNEDRNTPVKIMDNVAQVSCGEHTGILKKDGSLWMTGENTFGQLGDGTYSDRNTPVMIMEGEIREEPVTLNRSSSYIATGNTLTLKASGPSDMAFKTSNKKVATVTSKGVVKAVKPGTATITAYSKSDSSNKAVCKVTVKYRLTYKMDGGKNSPKNPEWYTGTVKLTNPQARKGWDFTGWYSDPKYKNKVTSVRNANKTLYAKWKWHSYYIKFEKNGGTGKQYFQACRYDKTFNLPACKYSRKGYSFAGWNTKADGKGKAYADKASFSNITSADKKTVPFYAQWKLNKYSITYQGLPSGAANTNKTIYTINTATFSLKNASCPGYDFKGWFSDSKKTKKFTSIAKGSTGNKTIYSKWTPHKYTIRFNANGGNGSMSSMPCEYGKQYSLKANAYQMEDYLFTGWNTMADGSGTAYADGAAVNNLTAKSGGSITLYAQWEPALQKAMWFMDQLYITQVPGGDYSHAGTQNFDVIGVNESGENVPHDIFAPFDCTVLEIYPSSNSGNTVIIQSTRKVRYADGSTDYMTMAFAHDNDISNLYVGKEIKQGEVFYQTGDYGNATGIHSHVTCIRGQYKGDYWTQNSQGNWSSPEGISPVSALYISGNTRIIEAMGLVFQSAE